MEVCATRTAFKTVQVNCNILYDRNLILICFKADRYDIVVHVYMVQGPYMYKAY